MPTDLSAYLSERTYPGRGIALGRSADGKKAVIVYFIMGRSVNSRNRVFVQTDDGIRTQAHDPAKMSDPSLIIYHPVRTVGRATVVTTGRAQLDAPHLRPGGPGRELQAVHPEEPGRRPRLLLPVFL